MPTLTLLAIAVGLAMDAFAVATATGLCLVNVTARQTLRMAWSFGLFQFFMPILGWLAGRGIERWISAFDHWVAFALLAIIGGKMIYESFAPQDDSRDVADPTRGGRLFVLSVATSIDALAVGLSLGVLRVQIWYPAFVIGVVAAALTALGMHLGCRFGAMLGRHVEVIGGLVLVGIGVKILVEHLGG